MRMSRNVTGVPMSSCILVQKPCIFFPLSRRVGRHPRPQRPGPAQIHTFITTVRLVMQQLQAECTERRGIGTHADTPIRDRCQRSLHIRGHGVITRADPIMKPMREREYCRRPPRTERDLRGSGYRRRGSPQPPVHAGRLQTAFRHRQTPKKSSSTSCSPRQRGLAGPRAGGPAQCRPR